MYVQLLLDECTSALDEGVTSSPILKTTSPASFVLSQSNNPLPAPEMLLILIFKWPSEICKSQQHM
jgi:hypothetical protein